MDFATAFHREITAFEAAARRAAQRDAAPLVPSCPGWSMADLVLHLGGVHRFVARIIGDGLTEPPDVTDVAVFALPEDRAGWPSPEGGPHRGPVPPGLVDWFADGARALEAHFRNGDPEQRVWTWSQERTAGFWWRMQTIEAALHRWDAEGANGTPPGPVETTLAADAVAQTFEVMAPARRAWKQAPPGAGERFRLRQTDGPGVWTVSFEGDTVRLGGDTGPCDLELTGTASDLMLFLWQRLPADRLDGVRGDPAMADRYFTLVPPV
jgi:uncharacterized protein (TIGR03083 family)